MEKVIFDTNSLRNTEPKHFLGNRVEIEKFAQVAEIIIPDIVIEEIKNQKVRNLSSKKQSFLSNPFHWMRDIDEDATKEFDIDDYIKKLESDEVIKYETIELSDSACLWEMKLMALKGLPPFEKGEKVGNDKGFKDAYIYFTILEYVQKVSDKYVFLVTNDGRLGEAFDNHSNIFVIKNFDEFKLKSISRYKSKYFLEKLYLEKEIQIDSENIKDFWINIRDNYILDIKIDNEKEIVLEVDEGEILDLEYKNNYNAIIDEFCNSTSFETTHSSIARLETYINYFSDDEILKILESTKENSQIYWIINDEDVRQFISILYDNKKDILSSELKNSIKDMFG